MEIIKTQQYDLYYKTLPASTKHDLPFFENALSSILQRIDGLIKSGGSHNAKTSKSKCLVIVDKKYSIWKLYIARKTNPNVKSGFRVYVANIANEDAWYLHIIYLKNEYDKNKNKIENDVKQITAKYSKL